MKIFRRKEDGKLYVIYYVKPPKILGSWYEAHPYKHKAKVRKIQEKDIESKFILVSEE